MRPIRNLFREQKKGQVYGQHASGHAQKVAPKSGYGIEILHTTRKGAIMDVHFEKKGKRAEKVTVMITQNKNLIGNFVLKAQPKLGERVAIIESAKIKPEYAKEGFAEPAIETMMVHAAGYGYTTVYASIGKTEKETIKELKKNGFKTAKRGSPIKSEANKATLVFENKTLK